MNKENTKSFHKSRGQIWKIIIDHEGKYLIVEDRDEDKHQVIFHCYELEALKPMAKPIAFDESWWMTIVAARRDILVFELFEDSHNPEEKSIHIADSQGEILWHRQKTSFRAWYDGHIEVNTSSDQGTNSLILEEKTGVVVDREPSGTSTDELWLSPQQYLEDDKYFDTLTRFIVEVTDHHMVRACEYLEYKNKVIISYYCIENEVLVNYLLVVTKDLQEDLFLQTGTELKGIGSDTFFVIHDKLFFTIQKDELVCHTL